MHVPGIKPQATSERKSESLLLMYLSHAPLQLWVTEDQYEHSCDIY